MIKKKSNTHELIVKNIAKLVLIQDATDYAPSRLADLFLCNKREDLTALGIKRRPPSAAYKYFSKHAKNYRAAAQTQAHQTLVKVIKEKYMSKEYIGYDFEHFSLGYRSQELAVVNFVRQAFKEVFPITPDMSRSEVASRNQRLGQMSVSMRIGDLPNYRFFDDAVFFMQRNVEAALFMTDLYILNMLNDKELDQDIAKLNTFQRLEENLGHKATSERKKFSKI